jgi:hypothetical protein
MRGSVARSILGIALLPAALVGTAGTANAAAGVPAHNPTASACTDIRSDVTVQRLGMALLALTNNSRRACTVHGWADIQLEGVDGNPVRLPVRKVNQPGPGDDITLAPGRTAFAGFKWRACHRADENCGLVSGVKVAAPGTRRYTDAKLIGIGNQPVTNISMASLTLGTLQPSTQGVVAW